MEEYLNQSSSNITSIAMRKNISTGLLGVCFLLGLPANISVVVFILRHFKKDNFTIHLMLNLAVSDILRLITIPLWMYNVNIDWALGRTLCKLLYLFVFTSGYSGVFTVTLMSVQRYLLVLHRRQWNKLGRRGEGALLCCLWTIALILSSSATVKADISTGEHFVCQRTFDQETLVILLCETLLGFVLPFSVLAGSYLCLHKKLSQSPFFSNPRLAKLVIAIIVTFMILWIPFHILNFVKILDIALASSNPTVSKKLESIWDASHDVAKTFTIFNSCVNPFLYACASRRLFQNTENSQENS